MKVKDLIDELKKYPPEMDIMISTYAEHISPINIHDAWDIDVDIDEYINPQIDLKVSHNCPAYEKKKVGNIGDIEKFEYQKTKKDMLKILFSFKGEEKWPN